MDGTLILLQQYILYLKLQRMCFEFYATSVKNSDRILTLTFNDWVPPAGEYLEMSSKAILEMWIMGITLNVL